MTTPDPIVDHATAAVLKGHYGQHDETTAELVRADVETALDAVRPLIEAEALRAVANTFQADNDEAVRGSKPGFRIFERVWSGPQIVERLRWWADNTEKGAKP